MAIAVFQDPECFEPSANSMKGCGRFPTAKHLNIVAWGWWLIDYLTKQWWDYAFLNSPKGLEVNRFVVRKLNGSGVLSERHPRHTWSLENAGGSWINSDWLRPLKTLIFSTYIEQRRRRMPETSARQFRLCANSANTSSLPESWARQFRQCTKSAKNSSWRETHISYALPSNRRISMWQTTYSVP